MRELSFDRQELEGARSVEDGDKDRPGEPDEVGLRCEEGVSERTPTLEERPSPDPAPPAGVSSLLGWEFRSPESVVVDWPPGNLHWPLILT